MTLLNGYRSSEHTSDILYEWMPWIGTAALVIVLGLGALIYDNYAKKDDIEEKIKPKTGYYIDHKTNPIETIT